ncbi:MAG: hypothetical protein R3C59_10725 [Planctomycetaceae bacterium]
MPHFEYRRGSLVCAMDGVPRNPTNALISSVASRVKPLSTCPVAKYTRVGKVVMGLANVIFDKVLNRYANLEGFSATVEEALKGPAIPSSDAGTPMRRHKIIFERSQGLRIESVHCVEQDETLRRIITWNHAQQSIWNPSIGWKKLSTLGSALMLANLVVPRFLLQAKNTVVDEMQIENIALLSENPSAKPVLDVSEVLLAGSRRLLIHSDKLTGVILKIEKFQPPPQPAIAQVETYNPLKFDVDEDSDLFRPS